MFKAPLSYVEQIVLPVRTDYLRGPLFVRGPPVEGSGR